MTDIDLMTKHLETVLETYREHGAQYGMADFVAPDDSEKTKIGLAVFMTIIERLGAMPFSVVKEEVVAKNRGMLVNVETKGPPEKEFRHRVYFRLDELDEPPAETVQ